MNTAFVGPMWAGKTTKLVEIAKNSKLGVTAIEPIWNTRRSSRELHALLKNSCVTILTWGDGHWNIPDTPVVLFDEIHFYDVFGGVLHFVELFKQTISIAKSVFVSGIFSDCYHDYRIFPLWGEILPLIDHVEILHSIQNCACGSPAYFTKSLGQCKVGDGYVNVCHKCR